LYHFTGVGEPSRFILREYQLLICNDVKDAVAAGNQLCIHPEGLPQLGRQTGGVRFVVSLRTVMDLNLHISPPDQHMHWIEEDGRIELDYTSVNNAAQRSFDADNAFSDQLLFIFSLRSPCRYLQ
jgi:hypothetical protein